MSEPMPQSDNLATQFSLLSIGSATSTTSSPSTVSTPSTTSSPEKSNSSTSNLSSPLASSSTSTTSSSIEPTLAIDSSTFEIPQQLSPIQNRFFQMESDRLDALSQKPQGKVVEQILALIQELNLLVTSSTTVTIPWSEEPTSNPNSSTPKIPPHMIIPPNMYFLWGTLMN